MNKRSAFLLVLCFSFILSFPWIGSRSFYTRGEPREALVPQKMIESSNWILPRTFDDRVPSKPPFSHWLIGLSAHLKGLLGSPVVVDEWSARFPSALLALSFIAIFYLWIEHALGFNRAFHACCILLTSFEWMRGLVTTRVDTVLSVMLGIAMLGLYSLVDKRKLSNVCCTILALTAATLTKGPVALVLPALIVGAYLLIEKRQLFRSLQIGLQIFLPALIIASFWYFLAFQEAGDDFLNKFWYENVERFASSTDDKPHNHSVFYLGIMFFVGLIPWSLLLFPRLVGLAKGSRLLEVIREWHRSLAPIERYALVVTVIVFAFFSIPSSKRGVYLLPASPFVALLLSRLTTREQFLGSAKLRRILSIFAVFTVGLIAILTLFFIFVPLSVIKDPFAADLLFFQKTTFRDNPISWLAAIGGISSVIWFYRRLRVPKQIFTPLIGALVGVITFFQGPVVNGFAAAVSEQRLAEQVKKIPEDVPLYSYYYEYYGVIFAAHRSVSLVGWQSAPSGVILVKERDYERFKQELPNNTTHQVIDRSAASVVQYGNRVLIIKFQQTADK